jgi:hypothetical protein
MLIDTPAANPDNEASTGKINHTALPPADKAPLLIEIKT